MKINLLNNILVWLFAVFIFVSCGMIKNVQQGTAVKVLLEKKLLDSIKEHELDIQWLKAMAKMPLNTLHKERLEF